MQIGGIGGLGDSRTDATQLASTDVMDATKDSNTTAETAVKQGIAFKGDTLTLSEQAKKLAANGKSASGKSADGTSAEGEGEEDPAVKVTKDRIKQLQEEIAELQKSDMDEKEKQQKIASLNQELSAQTVTLQKLQEGTDNRYGKGGLNFTMSSNMG